MDEQGRNVVLDQQYAFWVFAPSRRHARRSLSWLAALPAVPARGGDGSNGGAGRKKCPKRRNEPIMPFGINNLTQKTNPNEANKCFRFGIPFENEPKLGPKIC